jgi:anti-anti-sigma factor
MACLESSLDDGVTVVRIAGSLNQQGVDAVESPFAQSTGGSKRLVIDLSQVDLLNTPAIAMFLGAHRTMKHAGGRIIFTGVRGLVEDLLHRCRLDTVLTIVPDMREAVEWAKQ